MKAVAPGAPVHRVGRRPDAWAWPDWAYAAVDGTFGSRYDDPRGAYRVLYASTQRIGCFLEVLARFRPDPALVADLAEIEVEGEDDSLAPGVVPASWIEGRAIGRARLSGDYCDVGHSETLAWLGLDAAAIRASFPRRFTQRIGRRVYELADERGGRRFAGVRYLSRLGDEIENWAIFEPAILLDSESEHLDPDDRDLRAALVRFGLSMR